MKKILSKLLKVFTIATILMTTLLSNMPVTEVKALATNITGDQILAHGKATYSSWSYDAVGTCTGFVTRTLNDLGIGTSIVGNMVGSMAKYSPDQMYTNAMSNPSDATLIWEGQVANIGSVRNILKNGDLVIQKATDMSPYTGFGHVAFIDMDSSGIYMFGANNPTYGVSRATLATFLSYSKGIPVGQVDSKNVIRIFRLVDDVQPTYANLTSTKEAIESVKVSLTKTDVDTGKPLSDAIFDFYRDDVKFASDVKSNASGVANATSNVKFSGTSKSYRYCTNYNELSDQKKQEVVNAGIYTSKASAQADADKEAQQIANDKANQKHTYHVIETTTKTKYWLDRDNNTVTSDKTGSGDVTMTLTNARVRANVTLVKEDSVYGNSPQGDATLEGAVYGLFAKEDILDPADNSVIYTAGTKIAERTTKAGGTMTKITDLYLGKYYVQELEASNGYLLNSEKIDISLDYEGQDVKVVTRSATSKETVKKQAFEIIKISSDGESDNNVPTLQGAEFTYILTEYVTKYGSFDKALKAIKAGTTDIKATEWGTMTTDKKGYAKSKELPYGRYTVSETIVPDEHMKVNDFSVTVTKDSRDPQQWKIVNDASYKSMLAIVKQDAETGKTVQLENATFRVKNTDTNEYVSFWVWNPLPTYMTEFKTDETGQVFLPDVLEVGNYQLEEIRSPQGYLLNETPVRFRITEDNVTQVGPDAETPVLTVIMKDTSVKGKVNVTKEGEVLTSVTTNEDGNKEFNYETKRLANAVYDVYANEDIFTADHQGNLIYAKGTLVDTITTNADGSATSKELPLGKYIVREKTAPDGFSLNTEAKEVELTYKNQNTAIVYDSVSFKNERQKVSIKTQKKDADTDELVAEAEFTLYTKQDILSYDGKVLVKAKEKIETVKTAGDGKAKVIADLPLAEYTLKETKAPLGFASTDVVYDIDATYQGQSIPVIELSYEFVNEPTVISISKQDITTEVETAGNILQVFNAKGNKVDEWTSVEGEQHIIKYLHVGEEYTLVEYLAREGYLKAEDIKFTIRDTGEVQPVVIKDERVYGKITISKTGEVLVGTTEDKDGNITFVYKTQSLANAVYEIYANEDIKHPDGVTADIYKKDELVATLTTGEDGTITSDKLPLGRYRVVEKTAPEGFVNNASVQFVDLLYEDQFTELVYDTADYENQRQKVEISVKKQDSENETFLKGAEFTLYAGQDFMNVNGDLVVAKDTAIEKVVTDKDGKAKFKTDMPLGLYYVKETKAPIGYASNDVAVKVDATYQGQDVTLISTETGFVNDITKVEVSKTDITTGKELSGNHLTVFEKGNAGSVFDTWVSGDKPHMIYGLEVGKTYVLRETSSAYGFAISQDIEFTISDTGEIQKVKMENKLVEGQLAWNKTGEIFMATDTGMNELGIVHTPVWEKSNLLGSEITIYADEDITLGNGITYYLKDEAIQVLESDWETVYSKKIPVGKYYYKETKVPHGRIPDTDRHYFEIVDNQKDELQVIESELENGRTTYELDFTKRMEFSDTSINKEAYKDVVFGIYTLDDTYNYMGEVAMESDTLVGTTGIDEEGHFIQKFDLPVGNYYVKELATNSAYTLDENKYPFSIEQSSEEKVIIEINEGKALVNRLKEYYVLINKVDDKTMKNIISEDFAFTSYTDKECKNEIETIHANTKDGTAKFVLSYGTTYIKETQAPQGYKLSPEVVRVDVNDDGLFVNGKKIEHDEDLLYSIVYTNSLLPVIATGDTSNAQTYGMMFSISGVLLILLVLKKRKNKNKGNI